MKAIHVDFSPHSPGRVIASMRPVHWLLAGTAIVMCAGGMFALHNLLQQQDARQAELEQVRLQTATRGTIPDDKKKPAIPEAQAIAINSSIQQLNLPWGRLLAAIERATPSSVALLELSPDAKKHLVRGKAEAKTSGTMLAYITRLKQQPFMGNAILTKHEISDQDANGPLRFEFEAEWLEAGQ
jgi:Tfp pilus assembly protein PilN